MKPQLSWKLFQALYTNLVSIITQQEFDLVHRFTKENNAIYNVPYLGFRFEGKLFYTTEYPTQSVQLNHSLAVAFKEAYAPFKQFENEKLYIHTYLAKVTSECTTKADIRAFLPEPMHKIIDSVVGSALPETGVMSAEYIAEIKHKHEKAIMYLNQRVLSNMFEE